MRILKMLNSRSCRRFKLLKLSEPTSFINWKAQYLYDRPSIIQRFIDGKDFEFQPFFLYDAFEGWEKGDVISIAGCQWARFVLAFEIDPQIVGVEDSKIAD